MNDTEKLMREKFGDFNVDADIMRDVYMTDSQRAAYNRILSRAIQAQPAEGGVGFVLVPVEPTPEGMFGTDDLDFAEKLLQRGVDDADEWVCTDLCETAIEAAQEAAQPAAKEKGK